MFIQSCPNDFFLTMKTILVTVDLDSQGYFVIALGYNFLSGNSWDLVLAGNSYSGFSVKDTRIFRLSFCPFIADRCSSVSGLTMCHQEFHHDLSFILSQWIRSLERDVWSCNNPLLPRLLQGAVSTSSGN